jgi:hypothetical protein
MVFKQYDWCEDRIAFLKIDLMKENLWYAIEQKIWVPNSVTIAFINLDNIIQPIKNLIITKISK